MNTNYGISTLNCILHLDVFGKAKHNKKKKEFYNALVAHSRTHSFFRSNRNQQQRQQPLHVYAERSNGTFCDFLTPDWACLRASIFLLSFERCYLFWLGGCVSFSISAGSCCTIYGHYVCDHYGALQFKCVCLLILIADRSI